MDDYGDVVKLEALGQNGTLNARSGNVADELFSSSEFFDPRDLVQVKYEMLRKVRAEGASVTEAAGAFGMSRFSFYQGHALPARSHQKVRQNHSATSASHHELVQGSKGLFLRYS